MVGYNIEVGRLELATLQEYFYNNRLDTFKLGPPVADPGEVVWVHVAEPPPEHGLVGCAARTY